jgi:hypothetical protein
LGGFLGYRGSLFGREFGSAGFATFTPSELSKCYGCWVLLFGHARILAYTVKHRATGKSSG